MPFPEFGEPPPAGIALAVVLVVPVMVEDGLGRQGDHFLVLRVDHDGCIGLRTIGGLARLGGSFLQASGRGKSFGDKVGGPIPRDQNTLFHIDHLLEEFAALGPAEKLRECQAQRVRIDRIESFAHLCVAGSPLYAVDGLEIVVFDCPPSVEGKKARVLEGKHSIARHETIDQGDFGGVAALFSHLLERLANRSVKGVANKPPAHPDPFKPLLSCFLFPLDLSLFMEIRHTQLVRICPVKG
ncbi:MAG: hypothetical protein AB7V04_04110 [Desulfomonilaceae bacterium]